MSLLLLCANWQRGKFSRDQIRFKRFYLRCSRSVLSLLPSSSKVVFVFSSALQRCAVSWRISGPGSPAGQLTGGGPLLMTQLNTQHLKEPWKCFPCCLALSHRYKILMKSEKMSAIKSRAKSFDLHLKLRHDFILKSHALCNQG